MKKIGILIIMLALFVGFRAHAATTQSQVDAINSLTAQIKELQTQRQTLLSDLLTTLKQGTRSEAVTTLQSLLALDSSIYPEGLVTGYYGKLTAAAVKKFQKKNGLPQVGNVGPLTLKALKKFADESGVTAENEDDDGDGTAESNEGKKLCAIVPPGHLIAPGYLKKMGGVKPTIPECQTLPPGIAKKLKDTDWHVDPSDHTAPTISALGTSDLKATSVKINWTTNELAKDKVWVSTVPGVSTSGTANFVNNTATTTHSISATGLTAGTVYYYKVSSTDAGGNASISSEGTFTTTAADTTAPTISDITTSDITASGAKVNWTTNETANGKVYYGTANPIDTTVATSVNASSFTTSHSLTLSGLTANTTYYYVVESSDESSNKATGSQGSFTTIQ